MATSFIGSATAASNGTQSLVVPQHANGQSGDLLLVVISHRGGSNGVVATPSGWTKLAQSNVGTSLAHATYWRIRSASGPTTFNLNTGSNVKAVGICLTFRGNHPTDPIGGFSSRANVLNTEILHSAVTSTGHDTRVILSSISNDVSILQVGGWTVAATAASGGGGSSQRNRSTVQYQAHTTDNPGEVLAQIDGSSGSAGSQVTIVPEGQDLKARVAWAELETPAPGTVEPSGTISQSLPRIEQSLAGESGAPFKAKVAWTELEIPPAGETLPGVLASISQTLGSSGDEVTELVEETTGGGGRMEQSIGVHVGQGATISQALPMVAQELLGTIGEDIIHGFLEQTLPPVTQAASAFVAAVEAGVSQTLPSISQALAANVQEGSERIASVSQLLPRMAQSLQGTSEAEEDEAPHRMPPRRPVLPGVYWTINDTPVDVDTNWVASSNALGGHKQCALTIKENMARRFSVQQGATVKAHTDDRVIWEGRLAMDPAVSDGKAELSGVGHSARAEKKSGRALFQTRDLGLLQDQSDPPHSYLAPDSITGTDLLEVDVLEAAIRFIRRGGAFNEGAQQGVVIWVPGAFISRYAFDLAMSANLPSFHIRTSRSDGPFDGSAGTTVGNHSLSSNPSPVSQAVSQSPDALRLALRCASGTSPSGRVRVRMVNLRVNGIAPGDTYRSDEVASWLAGDLGYSSFGVEPSDKNILPLDWEGTWAELFDYVAMLEDRYWRVLEDRGSGPHLDFREWGEQEWVVSNEDARVELRPVEVYNRVIVRYQDISGAPNHGLADADPDPLMGTDMALGSFPNVFEDELEDPQTNDNLANEVAQALLRDMSRRRWAGQIQTSDPDSYYRKPGDVITVSDFGPGESATHRIHEVEHTSAGTSLGIEAPASAAGIIADWRTSQMRTTRNWRQMQRKERRAIARRKRKRERQRNR